MADRHKKGCYITGIFLIIIVIIISSLDYKKEVASTLLKDSKEILKEISADHKEKILLFASEVPEQYPIENVAIANKAAKLLDKDDFNKYLVELNTIGVDAYSNANLYTYYIVIEEDTKGNLSIMPCGVKYFKDVFDEVKREVIVSMMKALNHWGNKIGGF